MRSSQEIRRTFISFFEKKDHTFVKPSPVVPSDDPSILFTNAGMNQFKDVFLGVGTRPYRRAVNSQVCIRVSGKHNDLEEVGVDTYHLTLFEMLGNWSFGSYYKKETISWAWELMTAVLGFEKSKLYATVHESDQDSFDLWKSETDINPEHRLWFGNKENFWEMAEVGPCGPCTEIHYDRGPKACDRHGIAGHQCRVNGDCGRYIELWNLVFIQYERQSDGMLIDLPEKHVDTGAGFERLVAAMQGTFSIYETDLFQPIIRKVEALTGVSYKDENGLARIPHQVLADHIRTLTFAIADNVLPANDGRGYVLRRILRRAMRFAKQLGVTQPMVYQLVSTVVDVMKDYHQDLPARQAFVERLIRAEEESFLRTLNAGLEIFEKMASDAQAEGRDFMSGEDVFKLYDTFGFPVDLTQLMAKDKGMATDIAGFETLLEARREQSRRVVAVNPSQYQDMPRGGEARIVTDPQDRLNMARHHSATHLLQAALREILGPHVYQAGSLVDTDRLRFDFSHFQALTPDELARVESLVNQKIKAGLPVAAFHKPIEEAKKMGAMALFGEKYEDDVRVIQMGEFSMELCGGNHVQNTADIEVFKLISESGVSAGTRRIEALAGQTAIAAHAHQMRQKRLELAGFRYRDLLAAAKGKPLPALQKYLPEKLINASDTDLQAAIDEISTAIKQVEKAVAQEQGAVASAECKAILETARTLPAGAHVGVAHMRDKDIPYMRLLSDNLVNQDPSLAVILSSVSGDKAHVLVRVGSATKLGLKAPELIRKLTAIAGGSGGGRPEMAQAGGLDASKVSEAVEQVLEQLAAA
jgi:alanyl-tRNA synthetase